jgi:hypothetical protein
MSQNSWYLTIQKGPGPGQVHPLRGGAVTLGRHPDNQIVINDSQVSRYHARLTWQGSTYSVEDLGSANGTWVNNRRISQPTVLRPGDTVSLSRDIVLSFGGQPQGSAPTYLAPDYAAASPPARSSRTWLLLGIGGVLVAAVAVAALVLALAGGKDNGQGNPVVQVVTATATQGSVFVTATPQPTNPPPALPPTGAPSPTSQPTYTPYPTYTPFPTATTTGTPTQTPQPTYTPYPTYTSYPTQKPPKPKPPQPTTTPQPTATTQPPYTLSINKIEPEPWGRPTNPDGCNGPYNDRDPVKRFTIELIVTNQSNRTIPDDWYPVFYTAQGQTPTTCVWYYDNTAVQPGETTYVTFATHVETNDWVQSMRLSELGYDVVVCFNAAGQVVACP